MAHMKKQMLEKQDGWMVETRDCGTSFVPSSVLPIPGWLRRDYAVRMDDPVTDVATAQVQDILKSMLRDFVEGEQWLTVEALKPGYFYRLSAPGYLDCTSWGYDTNAKAAWRYLRELAA